MTAGALGENCLVILNEMKARAAELWEYRDDHECNIFDSTHAPYWYFYDCERVYFHKLPASVFKGHVFKWVDAVREKLQDYHYQVGKSCGKTSFFFS